MAYPYFQGQTLDDVMRSVIEEIFSHGDPIVASQGATKELAGVLLEVTDPRARLSRTETRGKPFSCLGELCWYLAASNDLSSILYYITKYKDFADGDEIFCGYGPRLFNWEGTDQVKNVTTLLRKKPTSRQAVIQMFDRGDIVGDHKDVSCTCSLQFMIRRDQLHMFTHMRSNDLFLGLPHDIFSFTMLQEIIARDLSIELGTYKHTVGSIHLYDRDREAAQRFHDEGWQSTQPMPPMPIGDPWPAITLLLKAESAIRTGDHLDTHLLGSVDPYWADFIRLLQVLRYKRDKNADGIRDLGKRMSSHVYTPFIDKVLSKMQ